MGHRSLRIPTSILCILLIFESRSQSCINATPSWQADIAGTCNQMVMTMAHDNSGKPFLYVANKEAGLKIYDISNLGSPILKKTLPPSLYDTLDVMNLFQQGNYLYLALGNHFSKTQPSGMAIVDIDTPEAAYVSDFWTLQGSLGGAGIVAAEGNYAYLGAMGNGLVVLDVTDKNNIVYKSKIVPDINYPTPSPNPDLYNARGMEVKNDVVYLCYDAGGIRIINVADKSKPMETGRFSNPLLNGKPRAYNNCVLDDTLLYVAVDYCGLEIINVKDTSKLSITGKWNPYNCPAINWFNTPVHANEIKLDRACQVLFISTGKSDLYVINITDPTNPDSCNIYGGVSNSIGSWGVDIFENKIFVSYVCAIIPFSSNWTGVKILTYAGCSGHVEITDSQSGLSLFPNPAKDFIQLRSDRYLSESEIESLRIYESSGREIPILFLARVDKTVNIRTAELHAGIYFLRMDLKRQKAHLRFVVE